MQLIARNASFWRARMIRPLHEYALYTLAACLLWFILIQHAAMAAGDGTKALPDRLEVVTAPAVRQPAPNRGAAATTSCDRCGVIEAVRETTRNATRAVSVESGYGHYAVALLSTLIGAKHANPTAQEVGPATNYEITVRFNDGSSRMLTELNPPKWKPGDSVKVINGRILPNS
jgi:hypothetical protein